MEKISDEKLKELGFKEDGWCQWWNGDVFIECFLLERKMTVYVCAQITSGTDYARPCLGVKDERDLVELCRLVNGPS